MHSWTQREPQSEYLLSRFAAKDLGDKLERAGFVYGDLDLEVHYVRRDWILIFGEAFAEHIIERGVARAHLSINLHHQGFCRAWS